ncbi:uncharacterized protein MP3633_1751 [Marinomonas primoryensis]|uniref:Uncharacterized protein n=1 Tax=Marinomonas primoryensis TaxID=178399 RepID=A0A859D0Y3_9GAMM|nr:uncharacterized protein MP3633_1751 [Marinomonas primoryensis]
MHNKIQIQSMSLDFLPFKLRVLLSLNKILENKWFLFRERLRSIK